MRPEDLLDLRGGLLLGEPALLDQAGDLALGDRAGLGQPGVHEVLADVLQLDRDPGGGDGLGDLAAHGPGADDGGLEDEHGPDVIHPRAAAALGWAAVRDEVLTARLRLRRPVVGEDEERYRRLFADPVVRAWLWPPAARAARHRGGRRRARPRRARWAGDGFGPWLLFAREGGDFVGRVGLARADLAGEAVVEVGWAVLGAHQGAGLATEAALAAVDAARGLGLAEVVAFTLAENVASRRVMERAGFALDGTVEHAGLPHVLYRRAP